MANTTKRTKKSTIIQAFGLLKNTDGSETLALWFRENPWSTVNVDLDMINECEVKVTRTAGYHSALAAEIAEFYGLDIEALKAAGEAPGDFLPGWILAHPDHGVIGFMRPKLQHNEKFYTFSKEEHAHANMKDALQKALNLKPRWQETKNSRKAK